MSKQYNLDTIRNLGGRIKFNWTEINEEGETEYYIIRLEFYGKAINEGASKTKIVGLNVNAPQSTPFTAKEIYQKIKNVMGNAVANKLKNLYIDLIDDDISQE